MLSPTVARIVMLLGIAVVFSTTVPCASAVPILSIDPPSLVAQPGQSVSLDVRIENVTDLYAFQFDLTFDPTLLSATTVHEGAFLSSGGDATFFVPGNIDNTGGTIIFISGTLIGLIPGISGSGTLATIDFQGLGSGTSPLTLSNIELLDSMLTPIPLNAVPEPATWLLLVTGCVGLLGYGWQRRGRKT